MKLKTLTTLATISLLTACATTPTPSNTNSQATAAPSTLSSKTSTTQLYSFPQDIEGGYWSMIGEIDGKYTVVDFKKNISNHYQFKCDNASKTYKMIGKTTYTLKPSIQGMEVIHNSEPTFSVLKVVQLQPKKVLFLNQSFINADMRKALPDGLEFGYIYSDKKHPLCGS